MVDAGELSLAQLQQEEYLVVLLLWVPVHNSECLDARVLFN